MINSVDIASLQPSWRVKGVFSLNPERTRFYSCYGSCWCSCWSWLPCSSSLCLVFGGQCCNCVCG